MKILKILVITIIYISLLKIFWLTFNADKSYIGSQRSLKESNFTRALFLANQSIKNNKNEPRYYYGRAKVYLAIKNKGGAVLDLEKAEKINRKNLVTLRNIVPIYYFLSINDLIKPGSEANLDEKYFQTTKNFYSSLKNYSPTDVGINVLLAKYERSLQMTVELNESLEIIKNLRPDLLDWHPSLN